MKNSIKSVGFVGAGTMGCFNALMASHAGYEVMVQDVAKDNLSRVRQRQKEIATWLVRAGDIDAKSVEPAIESISLSTDLSAAAGSDLVSESIFEQLELKQKIHRDLERLAGAETIITTNSSALLVSDIDVALSKGTKFAALHSHLGAPLYDIVGGPRCAPGITDTLVEYVLSLKGVPLVLQKEHPGYVFNAMLGSVLTTALMLVISGASTIENVDRAWMRTRQAPMGPFGMIDLFGIDLIYDSWKHRGTDRKNGAFQPAIVDFLMPFIKQGKLGVKTSKGFYQYPSPEYELQGFLNPHKDLQVPSNALTTVLLHTAVSLATKGIATPEQIDRAWIAASRLSIGPFGIIDKMSLTGFCELLEQSPSIISEEERLQAVDFIEPLVQRGALGKIANEGFYRYPQPAFLQQDFLMKR